MRIGTPLSPSATRVMLLGAGELGKEVVIELQRLGVEVIAVDRYGDAPAQQVAHRAHVIDMTDATALRALVLAERPHLVVPEIEAIATDELVRIEAEGLARVIPTAHAAHTTMNRERIRRLAAEELGLPTSRYAFASTLAELEAAVAGGIGYPCFVKPVMSSSGKGQSRVRDAAGVARAWEYALSAGRVKQPRVIVEGEVRFDFEITLLTVRHAAGTSYCEPIGHVQVDGDYVESWQPQAMSALAPAVRNDASTGRPRIERACSANSLRCWVTSVTRPVSCGRGLTSENQTSSPRTNNSTPKMPCPPSASVACRAIARARSSASTLMGWGCQDST